MEKKDCSSSRSRRRWQDYKMPSCGVEVVVDGAGGEEKRRRKEIESVSSVFRRYEKQ
jgi:hypothetical protein